MSAKYENEIRNLLKEVFNDWWIDEDDWAEVENYYLQVSGLSYNKISDYIEENIKKGDSLENQLKFCKALFKESGFEHKSLSGIKRKIKNIR